MIIEFHHLGEYMRHRARRTRFHNNAARNQIAGNRRRMNHWIKMAVAETERIDRIMLRAVKF